MKLRKIINELEKHAPRAIAETWDNVGLQVGDLECEVRKILLSLDTNTAVVNEASKIQAELIICHHPLIFKPLARLTTPNAMHEPIVNAIKSGIAVYCMHTNLDKIEGGTSFALAEQLGIVAAGTLVSEEGRREFKIVTYAPEDAIPGIFKALSDAGAGIIGDYSSCSFRVYGEGTFYAGEGTNPMAGQRGVINTEQEIRLEMTVAGPDLDNAVKKMIAAHPYEEVAYDVYPLKGQAKDGLGVIGELSKPQSLKQFADFCRSELDSQELRVAGELERKILRAAICGGSGGDLIGAAKKAQADVLVTGDIRYHQIQEARGRGLALIDLGHYATEVSALDVIEKWLMEIDQQTHVLRSKIDLRPWDYIGEFIR